MTPRRPFAVVARRFDKLTINAVSLVVATVATNLFGVLFWALAAHVRSPAAVGSAFAEISALILLSTIAQLNLTNIFIRFLPAAGRYTGRFVRNGYLAVSTLALVVGTAVAASGLAGRVVGGGVGDRVLFIVSVALFAIFALQDSVLTAMRITHWVPVENITFAVAKLVLLPLLVFLAGRSDVIVAFIVPVALAVVLVNTLLFVRAMPRLAALESGSLPSTRRLGSFLAAEYLSTLATLATGQIMPLLVVYELGSAAGAYLAIPWMALAAMLTVLYNISSSFIVEMVTDETHSQALLRRTMTLLGAATVCIVLSYVVIGPLLLPIVGSQYAARGAGVLRLVGASAPFVLVIVLYQTFTWLDQQVWRLLAIQIVTGAAFIGVSIPLLHRFGLSGAGYAYLATRGVAALLMVSPVWSRITRIRRRAGPSEVVSAS